MGSISYPVTLLDLVKVIALSMFWTNWIECACSPRILGYSFTPQNMISKGCHYHSTLGHFHTCLSNNWFILRTPFQQMIYSRNQISSINFNDLLFNGNCLWSNVSLFFFVIKLVDLWLHNELLQVYLLSFD
jgi:hypothetical protein